MALYPIPPPDDPPTFETLTTEFGEIRSPSLYVNVDYLGLLERCGSEAEAFAILGRLKDLLA